MSFDNPLLHLYQHASSDTFSSMRNFETGMTKQLAIMSPHINAKFKKIWLTYAEYTQYIISKHDGIKLPTTVNEK